MAGVSRPKIHWTIFAAAPIIALFALNTIKAQAQNIEPIADAGLSRYAGPDPVVLDGTGSYDPDSSGALSYTWQQISGPSVVIIDANTATPTIAGSIQPGTGRDPTPKPQGFPQTDEIQECEFELVVSDGELTSLPDKVRVVIVPDFGEDFVRHVNPPFDPNRPTVIFFAGGDCVTGPKWSAGLVPDEREIENMRANSIYFIDGYKPDKKYGEDWRTYYGCGDMIIVYLSSVAPDYKMPIQTIGLSTGGQPAIDVGIRLNATYRDARYSVNRVTLEDADVNCRSYQDYSESIDAFVASSFDGEQCWVDNYVSQLGDFYPNVLNVGFDTVDHALAYWWYESSWTNAELNKFNNGVVAGAYWSVVGPGKNLQLAWTPEEQMYKLKWHGGADSGYMDFWDEPNHPGRLPEPVKLVEPVDVGDPKGFVFTCEESENAIGYELLFGTDPHRVMDFDIISDTPAPPNEIITPPNSDGFWWTVRVRDQYGSTIFADPKYFSLNDPNDVVEVNEDNDGGQVELALGQILVVTLESNPSTGYCWEVAENNASILEQLGEAEFKPSDTGDPPLVGAGGWEIFRFKAVSAGQMILKLVYRRPWEDVEPLKTFTIEVIVH